MGKCMSKERGQDAIIQHISSPVRTDDGVGFALGRLSNSHQTRWVKYEDMPPSEEEKPVVCESQVLVNRPQSRSYSLSLTQPVTSNTRLSRDSKDMNRTLLSTSIFTERPKLSAAPKKSNDYKVSVSLPQQDIENVGAKPTTPFKGRGVLTETNQNVLPVPVTSKGVRGPRREACENVDVEDMLPRRVSPRRPLRPSLTEKEFQALDASPPPMKSPSSRLVQSLDSTAENPPHLPDVESTFHAPSSPKSSVGSMGSSLQSILSAIADPDSTLLVEEVVSMANAVQQKSPEPRVELPEPKASHIDTEESDDESFVSLISPEKARDSSVKAFRDSFDHSEDDEVHIETPTTVRSVRTRLPIDRAPQEGEDAYWKANALYNNALFEEEEERRSGSKTPPAKTFMEAGLPVAISKLALSTESVLDSGFLQVSASCDGLRNSRDGLISEKILNGICPADMVPELKRKSTVSEDILSPKDYPPSAKKVKSLAEGGLSIDLQTPELESWSDQLCDTQVNEREAAVLDNDIAEDVKAFLQVSKKVVLNFGPEGGAGSDNAAKYSLSQLDSHPFPGQKEFISGSSFARFFELETLLVTSDVRRMSGHGVEGLQIVGSELTELFSGNLKSPRGDAQPSELSYVDKSSKFDEKDAGVSIENNWNEATAETGDLSMAGDCNGAQNVQSGISCGTSLPSQVSDTSRATEMCSQVQHRRSFDEPKVSPSLPSSKSSPQASEVPATEDLISVVGEKEDAGQVALGRRASYPFSISSTTPDKRTSLVCSTKLFRDPDSYPEASSLSLEDFQFLLDSIDKEDHKKVSPTANWSPNPLASFGRSLLQKIRGSLPTTPASSLPATPKRSTGTTPVASATSTPQRSLPHTNSVALSQEEIAEIWGAFEQSHLM